METVIRIEGGEIFRVVSVANVFVKYKPSGSHCLQLWEDKQVFANGEIKERDRPLLKGHLGHCLSCTPYVASAQLRFGALA